MSNPVPHTRFLTVPRDGGVLLIATLFGLYPFLVKLYADGGYQGSASHNAELAPVCGS